MRLSDLLHRLKTQRARHQLVVEKREANCRHDGSGELCLACCTMLQIY